jgi:hypothetical protein
MDFAEVLYYFRLPVAPETTHTVAVMKPYGPPHDFLLAESSNTVYSCMKNDRVVIIDVKAIRSVVGMLLHRFERENRWFVVEKPGLDLWEMGGFEEESDDNDDADDE